MNPRLEDISSWWISLETRLQEVKVNKIANFDFVKIKLCFNKKKCGQNCYCYTWYGLIFHCIINARGLWGIMMNYINCIMYIHTL